MVVVYQPKGRCIIGKKKTVTETKNTYGYQPGADSADIRALRDTPKATADPSIPFQYAKLRASQANSFSNPLGSYTNAATREASGRVTNEALSQEQAVAQQQSQIGADNQNYARGATLAGITMPQFVQTGGTQTQTSGGGFWGDLLKGVVGSAAGVGMTALTGGGSLAARAGMSAGANAGASLT